MAVSITPTTTKLFIMSIPHSSVPSSQKVVSVVPITKVNEPSSIDIIIIGMITADINPNCQR